MFAFGLTTSHIFLLSVAPGVRFFIQFGSQRVRRYAEERGYVELFRAAGAELVPPSCGACINAGPGTSERPGQVSISAINRNFPGPSTLARTDPVLPT